MNEAELIYRMFTQKNFREGVEAAYELLKKDGVGIAKLHHIVRNVNENKDKFEEKHGEN